MKEIDDIKEEIAHEKDLIRESTIRLRILEKQAAQHGINSPAEKEAEIREITANNATRRKNIQEKENLITNVELLLSYIYESVDQKKWDEAIKYCEELIGLDDFIDVAKNHLLITYKKAGVYYHNLGEFDKAISYKNRLINIEPRNASHYYTRGVSLHGKKDYRNAIRDKTRAIELGKKTHRYFYSRAMSYYVNKNPIANLNQAISDMSSAISDMVSYIENVVNDKTPYKTNEVACKQVRVFLEASHLPSTVRWHKITIGYCIIFCDQRRAVLPVR